MLRVFLKMRAPNSLLQNHFQCLFKMQTITLLRFTELEFVYGLCIFLNLQLVVMEIND